ncbi:MAG: GPR endopeptidase [Clostridia bacterium]|nr:GPR endopeptidase [Clostridia bacterium]
MNNRIEHYLYSDMASELYKSAKEKQTPPFHLTGNPLHDSGFSYSEHYVDRIRTEKLVVATEEAANVLGKSIGTYYTVHTGDIRLHADSQYHACTEAILCALTDALRQLCPDFRIPSDPDKNNTFDGRTADYGFDKGTVLPTEIDDPGELAWDKLSVSPEWDQGAHLYNAPPAAFMHDKAAEEIRADGEPYLAPMHDRTAVTDIPPCPASDLTPPRPMTVLAVGLGNPALTPDSLGPMCVSRLNITRHLIGSNCEGSGMHGLDSSMHRLCAVTPLVLGQTGIETLELVCGAVRAVKPDLVLLIDALAASELGTLVRTVQISTTGIHPGGGVGNKREALDRESLGVPVMTVGIPTVISASTLIYRALEGAGLLPQEDEGTPYATDGSEALLHRALASADAGYVAPKDIDASVAEFAHLLAHCINSVFLGPAYAESWHSRA